MFDWLPESTVCTGHCGRLLRPAESTLEGPKVYCRGVCARCWMRDRRDGLRPPTQRVGAALLDIVLDDFELLAGSGVPFRDMPARIGVSPRVLKSAVRRARAAGDPRVAGWRRVAA